MLVGEFVALLVIVTPPVTTPADVGAKVTVNTTDCPAVSVCVDVTPPALKPAPDTVTCEIVTLEFPTFVSVTFCELVLPTVTLLKFRLVGFAVTWSVAITPVPVRGMVIGEFGALFVRVMLPLAVPVELGANAALKVAFFPALIVNGVLRPVILNPAPETIAWEIVKFALP